MKPESIGHKLVSMVITFILVDFAWIFFRADSINTAFDMIISMIHIGDVGSVLGGIYELGVSALGFKVLILSILILLFSDFIKYKGIRIRDVIINHELLCRWICYIGIIWFILVFGIWGGSYDASGFIYFQF